MQYIELDTNLYIQDHHLKTISDQINLWLSSWKDPFHWQIIDDTFIQDIEKERDEAIEDAETWEEQHDDLERELKRLEDKYDDLEIKYDDLQEKYNTLLSEHE